MIWHTETHKIIKNENREENLDEVIKKNRILMKILYLLRHFEILKLDASKSNFISKIFRISNKFINTSCLSWSTSHTSRMNHAFESNSYLINVCSITNCNLFLLIWNVCQTMWKESYDTVSLADLNQTSSRINA